ncbi:MAG: hypothetical protein K2X64_09235, partial [Rhodocyclaceae bacterium]|nr:hypothetical protein [Rhodocyclaceae bacterium]
SGFKPELALDSAKEVQAKTKEILGVDPMDPANQARFPDVASLFGATREVFADPDKYNLYKLVGEHQVENIKRELRDANQTNSILLDVGVVAFVSLTLALSRSPKVAAAAERALGSAGPRVAKVAGLFAAGLGAPALRHYGYEALTGTPESWKDTGVHVVGSLAAAEVGSRLLGRGSLVFGTPGSAPGVFEQFNKETAAGWLADHGYTTTGKVADLMRSNGFLREAKLLGALEAATPITSEAGLLAIETAQLTHARMGSVAKALGADLRRVSGVDQTKLAQALEGLSAGKIGSVGDLSRSIASDNKAVEEIVKLSSDLPRGASISDAVRAAGGTRQFELLAAAERLGVSTVAQARALAKSPATIERLFPQLHELMKKGAVSASDSLSTAASAGSHVFEGQGLEMLVNKIPLFERGGLLSAHSLSKMASGSGKLSKIEKAIADSGTSLNSVLMEAGLGTVTTETLTRTRWITAMLGSAGTLGTYNSTVRAWDIHNLSIDPNTGERYSFPDALREAHLPTVKSGIHPGVDFALSAMFGTPGQALVGAFFLQPGAIARANWADRDLSVARKLYNSMPLSHHAWSNLNATLLSKPGMGGV